MNSSIKLFNDTWKYKIIICEKVLIKKNIEFEFFFEVDFKRIISVFFLKKLLRIKVIFSSNLLNNFVKFFGGIKYL